MKRFLLGLLIGILVATGSHSLVAGFILRNQRVSTLQGTRSLTNDELAQAVMANDERIEVMQGELSKMRSENQKMQKDMGEVEAALIQFKNLYFRRF
jgi:TolA-binding protein